MDTPFSESPIPSIVVTLGFLLLSSPGLKNAVFFVWSRDVNRCMVYDAPTINVGPDDQETNKIMIFAL